MTNYRPVSLLTVLCKLLEKGSICMLKTNWSQKWESYQLKMLPSDKELVYLNPLTRKYMLEEFFVIWQRLFTAGIIDIDIFVNCSWVVTRWQYTFTHKQYIEQHKQHQENTNNN
jgi:hypothetical protein